jgi:hypothetical protein
MAVMLKLEVQAALGMPGMPVAQYMPVEGYKLAPAPVEVPATGGAAVYLPVAVEPHSETFHILNKNVHYQTTGFRS